MRTSKEILERIEHIKADDFFGFQMADLLDGLPFDDAKSFLKDEFVSRDGAKEEWEDKRLSTKDDVLKTMLDYFEFGMSKCVGHRGLSAGRTLDHYKAWLFLAGDDETLAFAEADENYAQYGAPVLRKIADVYGYDHEDLSDPDFIRMAEGRKCSSDCDGCGN